MKPPAIQVVVPVYNAYQALNNCIATLYRHNDSDSVMFIDDASDDHRIADLLAEYNEKCPAWTVFKNNQNMGFVKTANKGLKYSDGDTILLNADTLVTEGWLERLSECGRSVSGLATATPWSNNAEICSLPETLHNNPIPKDLDLLARTLRQNHQPTYPELPTAVGFCMLVTAQSKQQVGYFNEAIFGYGYGEENDYSLRATASGLRNVLVDNAYVAHVGNQSFGEKGLQPNQETMARLLAEHPNYAEIIDNFIKKDPIAPIRQSITDKIDAF